MLDTGIDVPEILNLVFFKLVRSKTKFWQMLGRGTRLAPDVFGPGADKTDFLVFDFCNNLEYFSQDLPGSEGNISKPLSQRIFETRVSVAAALSTQDHVFDGHYMESVADELAAFVGSLRLDNVLVRPHRAAVEQFQQKEAWTSLRNPADVERALSLGSVASTVKIDGNLEAKQFDLLMLGAQLAVVTGDGLALSKARSVVQSLAENLLTKTAIPVVNRQATLLEQVVSDEWWDCVTPALLEFARKKLRDLAHLLDKGHRRTVYTNFQDELFEPIEVEVVNTQVGMNQDRFEQKMQEHLHKHLDHVALQKLFRGKQITEADFAALTDLVDSSGIGNSVNVEFAKGQSGGLGVFIRSLVGLDRQAAQEAFALYLDESRFSARQIRFVQRIIDELSENGVVNPARLYEDPYVNMGDPFEMFGDDGAFEIVSILERIQKTAEVA